MYVDGGLTMRSHVSDIVSSAFAALQQIRSIKRSLPSEMLATLDTSLDFVRLYFCNAVLAR